VIKFESRIANGLKIQNQSIVVPRVVTNLDHIYRLAWATLKRTVVSFMPQTVPTGTDRELKL